MNAKIVLISDFHKLYKLQGFTSEVKKTFQDLIYSFYNHKKRNFPFRENVTPYKVVVSEIMLQQTQANRVAEKFLEFIKKFPDFKSLAEASVEEVLSAWQGLGYNRRAIALKKIGECIMSEFNGYVPKYLKTLISLPQIGHNTSYSILCFSYNIPTYFIETNIRRVYLYFFFPGRSQIDDKEIMEIVKISVDEDNPRDWYYALMDFGTMLKKTHPELNKKSVHYRKQSKFDGSTRQVRGKVLKLLLEKPISTKEIIDKINHEEKKILEILNTLKKEGFIQEEHEKFFIKN